MKRMLLIGALTVGASLTTAQAAEAKGYISAIRVCGSSGCATVHHPRAAMQRFGMDMLSNTGRHAERPPLLPYYRLRFLPSYEVPNSDAFYHNVFSLSKPKAFDLGRYAAGNSRPVRFDRPGIVRVFCDIHSHMSAFILVFAHRYFAVTDDEGRYRLDGVPPGTYTVLVWNETVHGDPPRRTVTIGDAGGDVDADFSIR